MTLKLGDVAFTQGRSSFLDRHRKVPEPTAKIYVRILLGEVRLPVNAQVDTGAAWSILDFETAQSLDLLDLDGPVTNLETRFGRIAGRLVRIPVRFVADEGEPFDTEGTFFVSSDWPYGVTFLGYSGMLDAIRFALDPQANHFYFGPGI
jgi:hypothetical protein